MLDSAHFSSTKVFLLEAQTPLATERIGFSLALLQRFFAIHFPPPQTFVLPKEAVQEIYATNAFPATLVKIFQNTNWENPLEIEEKSQQLQQAVLAFDIPAQLQKELLRLYSNELENKYLAVRPSFLHTTHNQQNLSELSVMGEANLLESLLRVLAKAYAPMYLLERHHEWQQHDFVPMALYIQPMISPTASGLAFVKEHVRIAATWGVSTLSLDHFADADQYEIDPHTNQIIETSIFPKTTKYFHELDGVRSVPVAAADQLRASLSNEQALALAKHIANASRLFHHPSAVAWTLSGDDGAFYCLEILPMVETSKKRPLPQNHTAPSQKLSTFSVRCFADESIQKATTAQGLADGIMIVDLPEEPLQALETYAQYFVKTPTLYRSHAQSLENTKLFSEEIRQIQIAEQRIHRDIQLLIPNIRSASEFIHSRKYIAQHHDTLAYNLWLECSLPINLFQMDELLAAQPAGVVFHLDALLAALFQTDTTDQHFHLLDEKTLRSLLAPLQTQLHKHSANVYLYLRTFYSFAVDVAMELGFTGVVVHPDNAREALDATQRIAATKDIREGKHTWQ